MKLLLIKIGKAWSVLRRDGVIRGGRRVLQAFISLFRPIGSGDILFISGGVGDSARYRTEHVAEELRLQGFQTAVTVQDNPRLYKAAARFQIFVLHRTLFTPKMARFIAELKQSGKTILFETDDLVYDAAYLVHMDYWHQMNALERKLYEHGVGGEILADPYVEGATTTTNFLADKLREKGKRVLVVPNRLSQQDVVWANEALKNRQTSIVHQQCVRVGYLSGTPSHNKDFATITDALCRLFDQYPDMKLVLAGPLDAEDRLMRYTDRIERVHFVPRSELFELIASLDINLAPLEIGNPFCESKSELKFFEAGIVRVPTVAAATQTFRQAITDGVDGYVADTTETWVEKIGGLIANAALRKQVGEAARATAEKRYTTLNAENEAYYQYLRKNIPKVQ